MRIIKEGTLPLNEKELECDYCHTTYAYLPTDIRDIKNPKFGEYYGTGFVDCPMCGSARNVRVAEIDIRALKLSAKSNHPGFTDFYWGQYKD